MRERRRRRWIRKEVGRGVGEGMERGQGSLSLTHLTNAHTDTHTKIDIACRGNVISMPSTEQDSKVQSP